MLDDLPWFFDPYIFHLISRTLSLVWFDQIYHFVLSPQSYFGFDHDEEILIKPQSLIRFINFILNFFKSKFIVFFVLMCSRIDHTSRLFCDPKSTSHFNFFLWLHVFPSRPHISQRGENICTIKWSPRLWAPIIQFLKFLDQFINFPESMVCNILLKSISLIKFNLFIF